MITSARIRVEGGQCTFDGGGGGSVEATESSAAERVGGSWGCR